MPAQDRGALSAKYESARAGSASISWDRTGGWSFGRYQFAAGGTVANGSAVTCFIKVLQQQAPELAQALIDAGGQPAARAGSAAFKQAWQLQATDPRFRVAEDDAAWSELVGPAVRLTQQETGLDITQRSLAVQSVMWSCAVQHGGSGAAHLWRNAFAWHDPRNMDDSTIINAVYDERSKVHIYFHSSTPQVQESVRNRFAHERRDALAMLTAQRALDADLDTVIVSLNAMLTELYGAAKQLIAGASTAQVQESVATSVAAGPEVLWLLELTKIALLKAGSREE